MQQRSVYWNIRQFLSGLSPTQHESSATHIAAADEIGWKQQTLAENVQKGSGIFSARDTAEQNVGARSLCMLVQQFSGFDQRISKQGIGFGDWNLCDDTELLDVHDRFGRNQASTWHNNERPRKAGWRCGKCLCINHLSSKIQAAHEGVNFTDRGTTLPKPSGEGEIGLFSQQH